MEMSKDCKSLRLLFFCLDEDVLKVSLDTFRYSKTFYFLRFSSLPAASRFFSDGIRKIVEKTLLVRQPQASKSKNQDCIFFPSFLLKEKKQKFKAAKNLAKNFTHFAKIK